MTRNPKMNIRQATIADSAAIATILRELGWFDYMNAESPSETGARVAHHLKMCKADGSHDVLVAEDSAEIVIGYASVHWLPYMMLQGPEGYVSELFVLESHRSKGVGRALLETITQRAQARDCARLHLITGRQRQSFTFYQKSGWQNRPDIADLILPLR